MQTYKFPFLAHAPRRGRCAETGRPIRKGETVAYFPSEKLMYCQRSQVFKDVRALVAVEGVRA